MRRALLLLSLAPLVLGADSRPRIRAVTAFIEIDRNNYAAKIDETQKFLAAAKEALNRAGFEGAGGRITTQPFPVYTKGHAARGCSRFDSQSCVNWRRRRAPDSTSARPC